MQEIIQVDTLFALMAVTAYFFLLFIFYYVIRIYWRVSENCDRLKTIQKEKLDDDLNWLIADNVDREYTESEQKQNLKNNLKPNI